MSGNFFRPGTLFTQPVGVTCDHDWPSLAAGVVIPHGLYDLSRQHGFVTLGTSPETREFACDRVRWWWPQHGRHDYPEATSLLWWCAGGGSTRANPGLFKADLEKFAPETRLEVRVAH